MDLQALNTELTAGHPDTGAYSGDATQAAAELNALNRSVDVEIVTGQAIFEAVVPADYDALSDADKTVFGLIVGLGEILVNGTNTKARLTAMFAGNTVTLAALAALQTEPVSRAVELGFGVVAAGHVQRARAT